MDEPGVSGRFAHLLKPLKDLEENWNIDLSEELATYMEELEAAEAVGDQEMRVSLNFAEAALLIQGSTAIFSKKVDYLYQLVVKAKDQIFDKKENKDKNKRDGGNQNVRVVEGDEDEDDFWDLDDIQPAKNIDLIEDPAVVALSKTEAPANPKHMMKPMPMSLIPLEEWEKSDVPVYGRNGEVNGKKDDFRVNTAFLHPCGILLLDYEDAKFLPDNFETDMTPKELANNFQDPAPDSGMMAPMDPDDPESSCCQEMDEQAVDGTQGGVELERDMAADEDEESCQKDGVQPLRGSVTLLKAAQRRKSTVGSLIADVGNFQSIGGEIPSQDPTPDPLPKLWAEQDEYDEKSAKAKKLGHPFRHPARNSRKRKLDGQPTVGADDEKTQLISREIEGQFYSRRNEMGRNSRRTSPLNYETLMDILWTASKARRQIHLRNDKAPTEVKGGGDEAAECEGGQEESDEEDVEAGDWDPIGVEFSDMDVRGEQVGASPPENEQGASYEELVKKYMDRYLSTAQEYLATTELTKRVQAWEDDVAPILRLEDQRRPFDIHQYGSEIIDRLEEIGNEKSFRELVEGEPAWEASRHFLASLMLANTDNVHISQTSSGTEDGINTMQLQLLSVHRHHEQFQLI